MMENEKNHKPQFDRSAFETEIHIETKKKLYAISNAELEMLKDGASSIWKDVAITSWSLAIPSFINAMIEFEKMDQQYTGELFANALAAAVGIIMGLLSSLLWYKSSSRIDHLLKEVSERIPFKL